jgi:glutathionyl-hydroquinone reductase
VLYEKLSALEQFLRGRVWAAGEFLTGADFSAFATFSAIYVSLKAYSLVST